MSAKGTPLEKFFFGGFRSRITDRQTALALIDPLKVAAKGGRRDAQDS